MDIPEKLGIPEYEFRLVFGVTKIEYDKSKEDVNRTKHGYSLESAVYYFERLLLPLNRKPFMTSDSFVENGEIRHMHMGVDDSGYVVLFVTTMRDEETVRIISFRRASEAECKEFHEHTGYNKQILSPEKSAGCDINPLRGFPR
ncbi:BrnT family toxin [Rheinheimera texasensis]|uniref:BrnT family toxin n=1 Tax=Rheinheimera texasensis TaxID=306205 RepID=UPI0009FD1269|nr:BrnT family toxin [Rheinheimera texasensis]